MWLFCCSTPAIVFATVTITVVFAFATVFFLWKRGASVLSVAVWVGKNVDVAGNIICFHGNEFFTRYAGCQRNQSLFLFQD